LIQTFFFLGFTECFPSTCTYKEKKDIANQIHRAPLFKLIVENNDFSVRRVLSTKKSGRRETRGSFATAQQVYLRRLQHEDLDEKSPQRQSPKESKNDSRELVLDLFKIDKSKAISEASPASQIYQEKNLPESRSYNFLKGAECGKFDHCYTRVTNFHLRSI